MELQLLLHNIGYVLCFILTASLSVIVWLKAIDRRQGLLMLLMNGAIMTFQLSHVVGVNIVDSEISRRILMFNLFDIFIIIFIAHTIFSILKIEKSQKLSLAIIYTSGISLFIFFIFNPSLFLLQSRPKMYFPNYYEGGPYYWVMVLYMTIVLFYILFQLGKTLIESRKGDDLVFYNRVKYVMAGVFFGLVLGYQAFPLVMNIPINPLWSIIHFVYVPLFTYAIIKYKMLDINVVAKKALLYAIGIAFATFFIGLTSYVNIQITERYSQISFWAIPLVSSIFALLIGRFVWRAIRESDILKHEFTNIISHKFRTPLTRIKWAVSNMEGEDEKVRNLAETEIHNSVESLIELTNMLVAVSDAGDSHTNKQQGTIDLSNLVLDVIKSKETQAKFKNVTLDNSINKDIYIDGNEDRIKFAIGVVVTNAITYSDRDKVVSVRLFKKDKKAVLQVEDQGIGIPNNEKKFIFKRFFRGDRAYKKDTEGLGIGLYMAKQVVIDSRGSIEFRSEGDDKGTVFQINFPLSKIVVSE